MGLSNQYPQKISAKKFNKVEVTFVKMLPDQVPSGAQAHYDWVYEEIAFSKMG